MSDPTYVYSQERLNGQLIVELLASVGITDWQKVIEVSCGPDPLLKVRRPHLNEEGRFHLDADRELELAEETLVFGVDWPLDYGRTGMPPYGGRWSRHFLRGRR